MKNSFSNSPTDPEFWERYVRNHNPNNHAIISNTDEYFLLINPDYDTSFHNQVRYIRGDAEKILAEMIELFKKRNKSFSIGVCDHNSTKNLIQTAKYLGFIEKQSYDRMILEVTKLISEKDNTKYKIRKITHTDLLHEDFLNINQISFPDYYLSIEDARKKVSRHLNMLKLNKFERFVYFGAFDTNDQPVGYGSISYDKKLSNVATLNGAAILPEHRGQGIYSQLLYYRKEHAETEGSHYLHIFANSETSSPIVRMKGFSHVEKVTFYHYNEQ